MKMKGNLLGSKLRCKILTCFFTHPEKTFYVRELQKLLKKDPTNISRVLKNLSDQGILKSEKRGGRKYYKANSNSPIYPELKSIILKTTGVAGSIKEKLSKLKNVKFAFIYGSFAKNTENINSDIDLMLVLEGKVNLDLLHEVMLEIENNLRREINYIIYNPEEFKGKILAQNGFLKNILKDRKIMLIGKEDELQRL